MNQGLYNNQKTADCMLSNLQDRQCTFNVILRRVRAAVDVVGKKAINITYSECVCVCVCVCF